MRILNAKNQNKESKSEYDLKSAIGRRVQLKILLEWDLKFSEGTIIKLLKTDAEQMIPNCKHVFYLIELDSHAIIQDQKNVYPLFSIGTPRIRKKIKGQVIATTKYIIIEIRRTEAIEDELRGKGVSEWSAPILYCPKTKNVFDLKEIKLKEDLIALGPGSIRIINESSAPSR